MVSGSIIVLCFLLPLIACVYFGWDETDAKLSDETLEEIEKLRWKHYYYYQGELFHLESISGDSIINPVFVDYRWTNAFLSIKVEGDRLIIETQDGKWFIEMEKMEE